MENIMEPTILMEDFTDTSIPGGVAASIGNQLDPEILMLLPYWYADNVYIINTKMPCFGFIRDRLDQTIKMSFEDVQNLSDGIPSSFDDIQGMDFEVFVKFLKSIEAKKTNDMLFLLLVAICRDELKRRQHVGTELIKTVDNIRNVIMS